MILVADDDRDMRDLLQTLLEGAGFDCAMASGGLEAVSMARELEPELIILDVMMPDLSGFEAFARIRATPSLENTPILFLSAASDERRVVRGYDLGAEDYLAKPFNQVTLMAKIRNVLARYRRSKPLSLEDFKPGFVIRDRYEVHHELGRGGMGIVYKCYDKQLCKDVALKVLSSNMGELEATERFQREVTALASVNHRNLVKLRDVEYGRDVSYYVMDFVPGLALDQRLRDGPLTPKNALEVVSKVADALQIAHDVGILHRDLKPANILFDALGEPMLTDFSLGLDTESDDRRLTKSGLIVGTMGYLSPEGLRSPSNVDTRSDVYALGVVLYECLTGKHLFEGDDDFDWMVKTVTQDPPPPHTLDGSIPEAASWVCMQALAREPKQRIQSPALFADAMRKALARI